MKKITTKIIDLIRAHQRFSALASLILLLVILIVCFILRMGSYNKLMENNDEIFVTIDPAVLQLPEEPLLLPPLQYSRKQKKIWTNADLQYWYTVPDQKQMQQLHQINEEKINKLWETVP